MSDLGYRSALPLATPMLTSAHKQRRVEWAQNDNWKKTLFSDETSFQLFRNTIKHWYKNAKPIRPMPKNRSKIFTWGWFLCKSLTCFQHIMDGKYYTEILEQHIPKIKSMFRGNWQLQQDNDPKHTSCIAQKQRSRGYGLAF